MQHHSVRPLVVTEHFLWYGDAQEVQIQKYFIIGLHLLAGGWLEPYEAALAGHGHLRKANRPDSRKLRLRAAHTPHTRTLHHDWGLILDVPIIFQKGLALKDYCPVNIQIPDRRSRN